MSKYAVLCGDAPEEFRQKKLEEMCDFLESSDGGLYEGREIISFPNGVSELMLEYTLNGAYEQKPKSVLLYLCTRAPVCDAESSVFLGGEEIRRDVIEHYSTLARDMGIDLQVIFDVCRDFVSETELGYEKVTQ